MVTEEELKNLSPAELQEMQKKNCIFCHISSGQVQSKKVYEDDKVLAVLDINPASPGHIIIFPKEHFVILPQIPEDLVGHLFKVARNLSAILLKNLKAKGTNVFIANGAVAGQKAPHFMMHVIPRTEGDGLNFSMPGKEMTKEQLADVRNKLLSKAATPQSTEQPVKASEESPPPEPKPDDESSDERPSPEPEESNKNADDDMDFEALKKALDNGM